IRLPAGSWVHCAASAHLASTLERARVAARGGASLLAVLRGDPDGVVAALALARVDPPRVTPARVLGGSDSGGEADEKDDCHDGARHVSHARNFTKATESLTRMSSRLHPLRGVWPPL